MDNNEQIKNLNLKWSKILENNERTIIGDHDLNDENIWDNTPGSDLTGTDLPSILPIAQRVFSKTIAHNLVNVQPMSGGLSKEGIEKLRDLEHTIEAENREGKIDSILENCTYKEVELEEDGRYKEILEEYTDGFPVGKLFYLDYTYDEDTDEEE